MGEQFTKRFAAMKLLMIFAIFFVSNTAAKKSVDPCVPCEVLKYAIEACPDCEILVDIWKNYCEDEIIEDEDEPCVPCKEIKMAIEFCPDCPVPYKLYKNYCDPEISTTISTSTSTTTSTSTVVPSEPCVPCELLKKAIYWCPDCKILQKIYKVNCVEITSDPEPTD